MYISASGALSSMYRQDVITNNLANVGTTGFKASMALARQRDAARTEDGLGHLPSSALLETLGAGVMMSPVRLRFEQGAIEQTGNDLDVAIRGKGFFLLRHESGEVGDTVRLTRDGRWARSADGLLVRASDGKAVLDASQREIRLPERGTVSIDGAGQISVDDRVVGRLAMVEAPDEAGIMPDGEGMYRLDSESAGRTFLPASGTLVHRAIEGSSVNPVATMMEMTAASRAVDSNLGMISERDRLLERAINGLGRVS